MRRRLAQRRVLRLQHRVTLVFDLSDARGHFVDMSGYKELKVGLIVDGHDSTAEAPGRLLSRRPIDGADTDSIGEK